MYNERIKYYFKFTIFEIFTPKIIATDTNSTKYNLFIGLFNGLKNVIYYNIL